MNNSKFKIELRRQIVHLLGAIFVIPLIYLQENSAIKFLAGFILLVLFANWYYEKRQMRNKYFKKLIDSMDLPEPDKKKWLEGANKFENFEKKLLLSFLEQFKRKKEKQPFFAIFSFLLSSTICLILFGKAIAIISILVLAFGDSASALIGSKFGRTKLFWNRELSLQGSLAFFAAASLSTYLFLVFFPQFLVAPILFVSIIAAAVGALTETIPTVNDNTTIPLAVGVSIWLLSLFP